MRKRIAVILIATGTLMLITAILFAFAVGGSAVWILTFSSVLINSVGITLLRGNQK